jgi:hypothetical protein
MGKNKDKKGFDLGHLSSQKFAGMVFCVAVLIAGGFWLPLTAFGNLVMGVTGIYTAFVGGRAYSDMQTLKYGGSVGGGDTAEMSRQRQAINTDLPAPEKIEVKDKGEELEID